VTTIPHPAQSLSCIRLHHPKLLILEQEHPLGGTNKRRANQISPSPKHTRRHITETVILFLPTRFFLYAKP
jgi:hypothetical protein